VEAGTDGAIHEDILAWQHMSAAGFLRDSYVMEDSSVSEPTIADSPTSVYGGYLQVALDHRWGYSTNGVLRHNGKTGNYVPAEVLAEVDRKIDDGLPGSGRFQFSTYAGQGAAPIGGVAGVARLRTRPLASGSPPGTTVVARRCCAEDNCNERTHEPPL
jgi:hypothetical protein